MWGENGEKLLIVRSQVELEKIVKVTQMGEQKTNKHKWNTGTLTMNWIKTKLSQLVKMSNGKDQTKDWNPQKR